MRKPISIGLALAAGTFAAAYLYSTHRESRGDGSFALLDRYCVECHNSSEFAGGVAFDALDTGAIHADAEIWEAAIRKLRGRQMPPPGEPRPALEQIDAFVARLEAGLDAAAAADPNPGAPVLHRLNRNEYANAIRDLLALPVDPAALLPADDSSEGFDNVANALSVSPAHMQAYVSAAAKISRLAVGDATISPEMTTYRAPRGLSQADHLDGMPLGTRGGMLIEHVFPLDAEYELTVGRAGGGFGLATVGADEDVEVTLNGARARLLGRGERAVRLAVPAGPQTIGVAIVRKRAAQGVDDLYSVLAGSPGVQSVSIMGPFAARGPGDTPSRRRIFICRPESGADERPCAREILQALAGRAFRRPLAAADPSIGMLMQFYEDGRALRGFETGIQYALARVLVDPRFIFRFEEEPTGLAEGAVYRLDDFELASRLSFFLWSSIPDDELLEAAGAGQLRDPALLEAQVRRMLADPKADALVENFAGQWLLLRQLDDVSPATNEFDGNLRLAMRRETELLFAAVLREDRSIVDLLDADFTHVDERLARHYGIANIRGSRFRRVALAADDPRRGLLGHASILTMTSAPNRTSPVRRGAWMLENLLGTPPPAPPEGVKTNLDEAAGAGAAPASLRERLERHRADPGCASCHAIMDPIGFALENFDLIGKWRDADGNEPVDPRGLLLDGTEVEGPASLREALLARQDLFVARATEKLLTYALGRRVEHYDMPAVRAIVRDAAGDDYRLSSLVVGVARSLPFQMKKKASATDSAN